MFHRHVSSQVTVLSSTECKAIISKSVMWVYDSTLWLSLCTHAASITTWPFVPWRNSASVEIVCGYFSQIPNWEKRRDWDGKHAVQVFIKFVPQNSTTTWRGVSICAQFVCTVITLYTCITLLKVIQGQDRKREGQVLMMFVTTTYSDNGQPNGGFLRVRTSLNYHELHKCDYEHKFTV